MRTALAIFAGVVAGGLVVAVVETIGHMVFPPPAGLDVTNPDDLAVLMEQIPAAALLFVLAAWALGAVAGGFTATKIDRTGRPLAALAAGGVLLAFGIMTMIQIPHPVWMWIFGVIVPLPSAYAGFRLAAPAPAPV